MMVMTAKLDLKKILIILGVVAAVIVGCILLFGGSDTKPTAAPSATDNDKRVAFLKEMGWEVSTSPVQSGKVQIPAQMSEVYERYNALQKSQGYDLSPYAGQTVMRYVYKVSNLPGATDPVYATVLVHKDQIIGGDVTDTSAGGQIRCFKNAPAQSATEPSIPDSTTPATT